MDEDTVLGFGFRATSVAVKPINTKVSSPGKPQAPEPE